LFLHLGLNRGTWFLPQVEEQLKVLFVRVYAATAFSPFHLRLAASTVWPELAASAAAVSAAHSAVWQALNARAATVPLAAAAEAATGAPPYASRAVLAPPAVAAAAVAAAVQRAGSRVRLAAVRVEHCVPLVEQGALGVPVFAPDARLVPPVALDVLVSRLAGLAAQAVFQSVPPAALPAGDRYHAARSALPRAGYHALVDHHGLF
jgi:hypothetical protein